MGLFEKVLYNKYVSIAFNIVYILGFFAAAERGVFLWYLLITTTVMILAFHKPLWTMMKLRGELYASWCVDKSHQVTKKIYPGYERKEEDEEKDVKVLK